MPPCNGQSAYPLVAYTAAKNTHSAKLETWVETRAGIRPTKTGINVHHPDARLPGKAQDKGNVAAAILNRDHSPARALHKDSPFPVTGKVATTLADTDLVVAAAPAPG